MKDITYEVARGDNTYFAADGVWVLGRERAERIMGCS